MPTSQPPSPPSRTRSSASTSALLAAVLATTTSTSGSPSHTVGSPVSRQSTPERQRTGSPASSRLSSAPNSTPPLGFCQDRSPGPPTQKDSPAGSSPKPSRNSPGPQQEAAIARQISPPEKLPQAVKRAGTFESQSSLANTAVKPNKRTKSKQPATVTRARTETLGDVILGRSQLDPHAQALRDATLRENGIAGHSLTTYQAAYKFGYLQGYLTLNYVGIKVSMSQPRKGPGKYLRLQGHLDALLENGNERPTVEAIAACERALRNSTGERVRTSGVDGPCKHLRLEDFVLAKAHLPNQPWKGSVPFDEVRRTEGFSTLNVIVGYSWGEWLCALQADLKELRELKLLKIGSFRS